MTKEEYEYIQARLRRKLSAGPGGLSGNRKEGYERGLNTAMSIIKEIYEKEGTNK